MKRLIFFILIFFITISCDNHPGMYAEKGVQQTDTWFYSLYNKNENKKGFYKIRIEYDLYLFESDEIAREQYKKIHKGNIPSTAGLAVIYHDGRVEIWEPLAYSKNRAVLNNWSLGHENWEILYSMYKKSNINIAFGNPDLVYKKEFYK